MTPKELKRALELALKDRQPELYAELKASNRLDEVLNPILGRAEESIAEARQQAIEAATTQGKPGYVADPMVRTQTLNLQFKEAENQALQQAVEEVTSQAAA